MGSENALLLFLAIIFGLIAEESRATTPKAFANFSPG
jgi:hypothetical protein